MKNRYYILLTRGIRGTYVFFEDPETKEYVARAASLSS
ncbi:MAG: DNA/RNA helicase domain-containing protein [Candidatus Parvarchaeota archaeon]